MKEDYIYAVARIRSRELSLLGRQDMDQLLACRTYEECLRVLGDKGWDTGEGGTAEKLLAAETEKTWGLIRELTEDLSPFDVLLCPIDYNNMKAAIKSVVSGSEPHQVFLSGGSIDPEELVGAVRGSDFSALPGRMAEAADRAFHILLETGDGQLCDVFLDRACLEEILCRGRASDSRILADYAELTAAMTDIKIAVRCCKTGKNRDFLQEAIAPCGTLDAGELITAACGEPEELYAFLRTTDYADAAEQLKLSYSAFEKWCDDRIMELIKEQKTNPFTVGPLFAYLLARQSEIASVRIILSGKLNELPDSVIRERLRELYV